MSSGVRLACASGRLRAPCRPSRAIGGVGVHWRQARAAFVGACGLAVRGRGAVHACAQHAAAVGGDDNDDDNDNRKDNRSAVAVARSAAPAMSSPASIPAERVRVRQHVNPLASHFQRTLELPERWPACAFADPALPLHVDIGCARGTFLLELALREREAESDGDADGGAEATRLRGRRQRRRNNYLGLEIRAPLVAHANERAARMGVHDRVEFIFCNANVALDGILSRYTATGGGGGPVECVTIQFPDPHFKRRHQKRRVVQPQLVGVLARHMAPGATLYVQSDVRAVAESMVEVIGAHAAFAPGRDRDDGAERRRSAWLTRSAMPAMTERERAVLSKCGGVVYRALFHRCAASVAADA